jgi:mono/diheme cytochrome c family protein
MRRLWIWSAALALVLSATGCGKQNEDGGSATSSNAGSASSSSGTGGASALPAGLDAGPRASAEPINEALVAQGEHLFQSKGCSACHAFGKKVTCPDLDGVTDRRTAKWIRSQILHPEVMTKQDPTAHQLFAQFALQMPNQGLNEAEAEAVLQFFKHQNHEAGEKH